MVFRGKVGDPIGAFKLLLFAGGSLFQRSCGAIAGESYQARRCSKQSKGVIMATTTFTLRPCVVETLLHALVFHPRLLSVPIEG